MEHDGAEISPTTFRGPDGHTGSSRSWPPPPMRRLGCAVRLMVLGVAFCYALYYAERLIPERGAIRVGMSKDQLRESWGEPRDWGRIGDRREIWYYPMWHWKTPLFTLKRAGKWSVPSVEDLSYRYYGYIAILLDQTGHVEAYVWEGESDPIKSKHGDIPGDHLRYYGRYLREKGLK